MKMKWTLLMISFLIYFPAHPVEFPSPGSESVATIFGGVGRQYENWHLGLDLMLISTPHTSAYRRISLSNRSVWLEWWPNDRYGVKAFNAIQNFQSFSANAININSRHTGGIFKLRFPVNPDWHATAGAGLGKTETETENHNHSATTLITEFRIGSRIMHKLILEGGVLTFDGSSGDNPKDIRLGSTNYVFGFQTGF